MWIESVCVERGREGKMCNEGQSSYIAAFVMAQVSGSDDTCGLEDNRRPTLHTHSTARLTVGVPIHRHRHGRVSSAGAVQTRRDS
jgi:hypothetical protein